MAENDKSKSKNKTLGDSCMLHNLILGKLTNLNFNLFPKEVYKGVKWHLLLHRLSEKVV
jgi:hypothetical protein